MTGCHVAQVYRLIPAGTKIEVIRKVQQFQPQGQD
jgi:hypothetical protein